MRKIYFVMMIVLAMCLQIRAQSEAKVFRGTIGDKNVRMTLTRTGGKLRGKYSYAKIGKDLNLAGTIDAEGNFKLDETLPGGAKTGEIKGVWRAGEDETVTLEGEWINPKTKQNLGFSAVGQAIYFSGGVAFETKSFAETNKPKMFEISAEYPELSGALKFNQAIKSLVMKEVGDFRKSMLEQTAEDLKFSRDRGVNNYLEMGYQIDFADDRVASIGFGTSVYSGGAHPNHYSMSLNYDLKNNRVIELADLFKPNSAYLKVISDYCVADIKRQVEDMSDDEWITNGAGPKTENFKSWNITKKGILINFDPYQVAAYAAGAFQVVVPYSELKNVLRENSAVADLSKGNL